MLKTLCLLLGTISLHAQQISKECFNKAGDFADEKNSEYCVIGKKILRIEEAVGTFDTIETYVDTVHAYYTGINKIKFIKLYNKEGLQHGNFVEHFSNGKVKERGSFKDGRKFSYVASYYPSGKRRSILQYFSEQEKVSEWHELDFKILDYWDSTGHQIIEKGNGFCDCTLVSGRREIGRVVNGLRDSVWSEYSRDTLVLMESYAAGKFIEGVRYYKGQAFKYKQFTSQPAYAEGYEGIIDVLLKNMQYPVSARRMGIDGTVYISFVVFENGSIDDIKITRGISNDCDREAVRVVKLLKQWYPAQLRGRPVNVRYNLPVKFKLN